MVILYNKPPGVVVTHAIDDILGRPNAYEQVMKMDGFVHVNKRIPMYFEVQTGIRSKLHAIGRLDAATTGLLLMTNDGGLVHHVTNKEASTHPNEKPITKTYEALIMGHHSSDSSMFQTLLSEGVDIGTKYGGQTMPVDDLRVIETRKTSTLVEVTIHEGKNRQVRRMFHSLGSGVMELRRTRIGQSLDLGNLSQGEWRLLSKEEILQELNWGVRELTRATMYNKTRLRPRSSGYKGRKSRSKRSSKKRQT